MKENKTINDGKVLYISGYGDDSNETVVYALTMPVSVKVYIDDDGRGVVEFRENAGGDNWIHACLTGFIPGAPAPAQIKKMVRELSLEDNVAKTVAGWISIFMRDGVFCTDSQKETFVHYLDLRDIKDRLEKNLEDVYNKYRDKYN